MKLILKSVSRLAARCSCGMKEAGGLWGAVETSAALHRPNSTYGFANQRLPDQEVEGIPVPGTNEIRTGPMSTKKIEVKIFQKIFPRRKKICVLLCTFSIQVP